MLDVGIVASVTRAARVILHDRPLHEPRLDNVLNLQCCMGDKPS